MRELDKILDKDEKIFWEGKPRFLPFILSVALIPTLFGLVWLIFTIPFFVAMIQKSPIGWWVLLTPHFWIGFVLIFGVPLYQVLVYRFIYYAITNKRVIFQKGLIGRDFEMVDLDQITNAEVKVGVIDKLFGRNSGSILIATAGSFTFTRQGPIKRPYTMRHIPRPYEAFKVLKEVSHAVKTDIEFPNKYRPEVNPGYKTNYNYKPTEGSNNEK